MAIKLKVSIAPAVILAVLKKKIDNKEIDTWEYDEEISHILLHNGRIRLGLLLYVKMTYLNLEYWVEKKLK